MAQTLSINEAQTFISTYLDASWEIDDPRPLAYTDYMIVKNMERGEFVDYRIAGFGKLVERGELEDIDYDQLEFGETETTKPKNWGRGFKVSEEVIEDLADSPWGGEIRAKLGAYGDCVSRWRRSADWTVEQECANKLLNGTSTAADYILRDSIAWFGSHVTLKNPTLTQVNLATHASLSATTINNMATTLNLQIDDKGDYISKSGRNKLVVSESDATRAWEIMNTTGQVDSANNNANTVKKHKWDVVENAYLNVNAATYAGYFVLREGVHGAHWFWRKKPVFAKDNDFDAIAMKYRARMRGVAKVRWWQGAVGDNGS